MLALLKVLRITSLCCLAGGLARLQLFLSNSQEFSRLTSTELLQGFIAGLRFDLAGFLPFFALPLLCLILPLPAKRQPAWQRWWSWVCFGVFALLLISLVGSVQYYAHAGRHVADELAQLGNDAGFLVPYLLKGNLLLLLTVLSMIVGFGFFWRFFIVAPLGAPSRPRHLLATIALLALSIRGSVSLKPIAAIDAYAQGKRELGNLILNGVFTASRAMLTFNEVPRPLLPAAELQRALAPLGIDAANPYPFMEHFVGTGSKKNIVVILLESWSHLYVDSFAHHDFKVTPFFDELASKSRRFVNYYANGTRSIEAIQTILSGVPPIKGIPTIDQGLDLSVVPRIGALAAQQGYSSVFVQSSKRRSFRLDAVAQSLGFGSYYGWEDTKLLRDYPDPTAPQFGWDYETLMLLHDKISALPEPFFAFMFSGTTHTPFALPPSSCQRHPHGADSEGGFLNTLCYSDESLREFFKRAQQQPWFKQTTFILTADHTLGAYRYHSFLERHHIPLLIYEPSNEVPYEETKYASHLDLFPTLLALMGGAISAPTLGQSLFSPGAGRVLVTGRYDHIAMIVPTGYLVHSYREVIEHSLSPNEVEPMAASLLALEHLAYNVLRKKTWLEHQ